MSLTLSQIRTMMQQMLQIDLDMALTSSGESPTTSDYNAVINQALRFISRRLVLISASSSLTLVNGQLAYNLRDTTTPVVSQRIVVPFRVSINGAPLQDRWSRAYGLWSLHELERQFPTYQTDPSGTPTVACWLGNNGGSNLILYPAPNASVVSGGNNTLSGVVLATELTSDSQVPAIPEECHEAVAALAAVYASIPAATEQEAWQRVQAIGKFHEPVEFVRSSNLQLARAYMGNDAQMFRLFVDADPAPASSGP